MIKSDRWMRRIALDKGMIEPFEDRQVRQGAISYGLSSYGCDTFKILTNMDVSYGNRQGKYQAQQGIVLPAV